MREIRVATVQFENRDNDKGYNLERIDQLARVAVDRGAEIVSFHECCIPAYSLFCSLCRRQNHNWPCMPNRFPMVPATARLIEIARAYNDGA